ncbi:right-handed parallel beta-helix repeat-containing protein [Tichowtungia aerotolerans]|uniref:Right handed beta helix domain-containing protein n=1 Tax=Tichowtungia aerotolerans TaxID=2697043 RepID=A0A6P1M5M2_9BACT|nr:right-handed parallel beta-helix repeat-containing protein [Tichowtungia aerotolerans]QHI69141.1 hypothetical protein GT409_06655 [Tichowtungia aerotolerans]
MKILLSLLLSAVLAGTCSAMNTLYIEDFGAVGDGKQDDIAAIVKAIDALKSGDTLEFSAGKIYRLGLRDDSIAQIDLQNMTNVTVNGNGSMMLTTPRQAAIRVKHCENVTVKGFVIEQDPLAFTQGAITKILPEEGVFEMKIMEGYDLLPTDEMRKAAGFPGWEWGAILDQSQRRIRRGVRDHFRSTRIEHLGERLYRVYLQQGFVDDLKQVQVGDIYFQPIQYNVQSRLSRIDGGRYAASIHVTNSGDCLIENITLYSGRSSMTSRVDLNYGRITFRGFKVMFRPGTDRIVTNWRDGMHCKDNRIGPIIEDCYFEGMLDDSINLSQNTIMAAEKLTDRTFRMRKNEGPERWTKYSSSIWLGDEIMVFYPTTGEYAGPLRVITVDPNAPDTITFDQPVKNVVLASGQTGGAADKHTTHFYNMNMCNAGFIVRNNRFLPQRRHAVLTRSIDGVIENNVIDGVGGHGIEIQNEYGHFYEGPFPQNILIRNNTIRNTYNSPIRVCTQSGQAGVQVVRNIRMEGNIITSDEPAIELENVSDVMIENNRFYALDGNVMRNPVHMENSIDVKIK